MMNKGIMVVALLGLLAYYSIHQTKNKPAGARPSLHPTAIYQPGDSLLPIFYANRWGFINQNGDVLIQPRYRNIGRFRNGLAPARLHGRYGYINYQGEFSIPDIYDYAVDFSEGLARVWKDGKCFFIDDKGR